MMDPLVAQFFDSVNGPKVNKQEGTYTYTAHRRDGAQIEIVVSRVDLGNGTSRYETANTPMNKACWTAEAALHEGLIWTATTLSLHREEAMGESDEIQDLLTQIAALQGQMQASEIET